MICPDCHKGMVQVQVRSSEMGGWFKAIPCPRCNGSGIAYCCDGEDAGCDADTLYGDQASTLEDQPMVA